MKKALPPALILFLLLLGPLLLLRPSSAPDSPVGPLAAQLEVLEILPSSCHSLLNPVMRWRVNYAGPGFPMKLIRSSPAGRAEREFLSPPPQEIASNSNRDIFSPALPAHSLFRYEFINLQSGQTLALIEFDCSTGEIKGPGPSPSPP
jgi:hypothetical protein